MPQSNQQAAFPLALLLAFLIIAGLLAIRPLYPRDWALENLIVLATLPALVCGYRRLRFSNASYFALFVLYVVHEVGAHYTYAEVPFDLWTMELFGFSITEHFGFSRNHYDRLVHFLYGLLATPAVMELLAARARPRGIWRWILPTSFVLSHAALYELLEWAAAILFGGDLGQAYLGTQGDPWDAHQDILLALLGSMVAMPLLWLSRRLRPAARQSATHAFIT
ncbi:DUF2238 domain-containing protein [Pseudoxanthomonas sacheonensis]|uniref:DUF2238 domain-containing protein n=1 Tax=Pseudoxanthomonas sacheonensis TaxID=443615 RepID=UPI0013D05A7E|nr:DUF2238 domain-containing protein [Pseudoxanthomonas sacheonensis]KAF1710751.1 hypothetical protein CSC73_04005 [Pseudoxanthomonas sacheonensis]